MNGLEVIWIVISHRLDWVLSVVDDVGIGHRTGKGKDGENGNLKNVDIEKQTFFSSNVRLTIFAAV